jgi:hypothetical protein
VHLTFCREWQREAELKKWCTNGYLMNCGSRRRSGAATPQRVPPWVAGVYKWQTGRLP